MKEKITLNTCSSIFRSEADLRASSSSTRTRLIGTALRQDILFTLYQQQYRLFIIRTLLRSVTRGYSLFTPASVPKSYARTHASRRQGLPNGLITISIIVVGHLLVPWKTFWCGFDIPCVHLPSQPSHDKLILKHLIAAGRGCIFEIVSIHRRQVEIQVLLWR